MAEYWEDVYQRGLKTIGIWQTFAPAFTVGDLALADHTTDVNGLPTKANDREVQQDALDDARLARKGNFNIMDDLGVRFPRLLEGVLPPDDPWHAEIADIRDITPDSHDRIAQRARRVVSLWNRVNAQRAGATPPKPALLVGDKAMADLQATLDGLGALLQAVETEEGELTEKREALKALAKMTDKNNKRWFAAWEGNFAEGSPERNALSQIDTGPGTASPVPYEIAQLLDRGDQAVEVSYVEGGGAHATTLTLYWWELQNEAAYAHSAPLVALGQTATGLTAGTPIRFVTRAVNSTGYTESSPQDITVT